MSRTTHGLSSVAARNAVTAVIARLSTILVGIILTPFVLHKLGRDLYGVVVAAGSIYEYLSLLRGGVAGALRRYVTLHYHAGRLQAARDFYAAGFWWGGILRFVILAAGLALAPSIAGFILHYAATLLRP